MKHEKTFENRKLNRIPWTVVGIVFIALIAAITVIIAELGIGENTNAQLYAKLKKQ